MSIKIRVATDGMAIFECPGCGESHGIPVRGDHVWGWNGSVESPTFTPSILVRYPANPNAIEEFKEWRAERRCHSFVTDGRIQFLDDCTHSLSGKTVDLPDWGSA
jgi:hypothetical protein